MQIYHSRLGAYAKKVARITHRVKKLGGNVLPEPAAAMVHMLSLVMYALCSPSSLTNKWDKLPIA